MEKERAAEAAGGPPSSSMATSREAAYRDAQPPQHTQPASHGHSRVSSMGAPEHQHGQPFRPQAEVELNQVITRLEQQVSYNYNVIQAHQNDIVRVSDTIARVQNEMMQVIGVMEEMRNELRSRPPPPRTLDPGRYDPADVEVLANQIANVTTKVNEVDNLKISIELMKQRLKRYENQSSNVTPGPPSDAVVPRPDQQSYEALRAQQTHQAPGHPLPPIRAGAALPSEQRQQPGHPPGPVLESQSTPGFHPSHERPPNATDQAHQAARPPGFRAAEPLPPPTAVSGWRSAESYPPSGGPPPAHGHPLRSHPPEPEIQASGWAAVNSNQAPKRPLDEHHPQHESQPGSPKRPKLVQLKPRSSFGDEHHHHSPYPQPAHVDASQQARGRIPSGEIPIQPHSHMNIAQGPGPGATNSYRFITSTGQPDGQEHWRPAEGEQGPGARFELTTASGTGRGRGRGSRGGRGRGGRGRGGRSSSGAADHPPPAPEATSQEHVQVPPEWREHQWAATQQAASNGHYPPQHAYSPTEPARLPPADLAVHTGAPHGMPYPPGHEHEFPATPIASNADPYAMAHDLDSASKKTRTKPIRNSDGVLIRKDGRPDMRSVSSANNLRKVHAKKEAEKAEMEGRTPTSGRSLAPANSSSLSDDEGMDEGDYMDEGDERERAVDSEGRTGTPGTQPDAERSEQVARHREFMSRMFTDDANRTAEAWFPRNEGPLLGLKREGQDNKEREARWRGIDDTTMRDSQPLEEREASQRASQQASREQTSVEATLQEPVASEPAASEQPEGEVEAAAVPGAPDSAEASVVGEKEMAKKDSTQLQSGSEPLASEPAVASEPVA